MSLSLFFSALGIVVSAAVAAREHANTKASRLGLLNLCSGLLSGSVIRHQGDGFPTLEGYRQGRFIRAELFSDSMTFRRLPQLWLKLTRIEVRGDIPEFAVLVRPTGAEFYSLTERLPSSLRPPGGFSTEVVARGEGTRAQRLIDAITPVLREIFSDQRMKEIAVTKKGLRLVWQAAEGDRGSHLLLRQCRFERAALMPDDFAARLAVLDLLSAAINRATEARAA